MFLKVNSKCFVFIFVVINYLIGLHSSVSQNIYTSDFSPPKRVFQSFQRRQFQQMGSLRKKCGAWDDRSDSCGANMIFYKHPLKGCESLGFCDCDQGYRKEDGRCKGLPIRMRLYYPETKQCYPVFAQGPCKPREWLIMDEEHLEPKCVLNQCFPRGFSTNSTSNQFWFFHSGRKRCYQSLTQGYCEAGKTLELVHESQYPQCKEACSYGLLSVRSPLACRAGTRYSRFLGSCRSNIRLSPRSNIG